MCTSASQVSRRRSASIATVPRLLSSTSGEEGSMFDHVGLNVRDYAASRAFYEQALAPLGYRVVMAFDEWKAAGFGMHDKPDFWISQREPVGTGTHVAFTCGDRAAVDAFHEAALAAGGFRSRAPGYQAGVRPRQRRHYRRSRGRRRHRVR